MSEPPIRLCVVGDFQGPHTRRWVEYFAARPYFEVHLISYYPAAPIPGATLHVLSPGVNPPSAATAPDPMRPVGIARGLYATVPRQFKHLLDAGRYRWNGLGRVIRSIHPDVLHSHFLVEHSFFASTVGYHPHVVTAWGSDVMVMAERSWIERQIVRYTLRRADLVVTNNKHLSRRTRRLAPTGVPVETVTLGIDRAFLSGFERSVNVAPGADGATVISTRSLDSPLYRVDDIIRAVAIVRGQRPDVRLLIAGDGRLRPRYEQLARDLSLGSAVRFVGFLSRSEMMDLLPQSAVYVSVPESDATALSTLEAMASGCFPVVSDLPSQDGLIADGRTGFRTPVADPLRLAGRIAEALSNADLRRSAAVANWSFVEEHGLLEPNLKRLEDWYYRLAGRSRHA